MIFGPPVGVKTVTSFTLPGVIKHDNTQVFVVQLPGDLFLGLPFVRPLK